MATGISGQFLPESNPESVKTRKRIWTVFYILLAITAFEFIVAFTKGPLHIPHILVLTIFISLTIVKAFYIVAEFMHLKHEMKVLIWSVVIPTVFIIWLIVALLMEGGSH